MDDSEEIENTVELSERNWNRVVNAAAKAGYREGVEEGKQSVFQQGFDIGYEDGFKAAFLLGKYKGLVTSLANVDRTSSSVDEILAKTRRGACNICANESKVSKSEADDFAEPPLEKVRDEQEEHSKKAMETVRQYLEELLKVRETSVEDFKL